MADRYYRLRVRNAADTADAFTFTSVRGGTNPYITAPPSGDGQEVDLLTGAIRTGAYQVLVADAVVGTDDIGTVRTVTQYLYDAGFGFLAKEDGSGLILLENGDDIVVSSDYAYARPDLLSRRAYIEVSTDGVTWPTVWQFGYITNISQVDAITYSFTVSDSRRVEQTQRVFTWSKKESPQPGETDELTEFPQRGCIFGGPVIGGFGAKVGNTTTAIDSGGWEFELADYGFQGLTKSLTVAFYFKAAFYPPAFERTLYIDQLDSNKFWGTLKKYLVPEPPDRFLVGAAFNFINSNIPGQATYSYPDVTAIVEDPTDSSKRWTGYIRAWLTPIFNPNVPAQYGRPAPVAASTTMYINFDAASISNGDPFPAMTVGKTYRIRGVSREVTPDAPLYFDLHPVDVVTKLYSIVNIPYKTGGGVNSAEWIKEQLGPTLRLAARITEPHLMSEFLEKAIFGPFGFAARTNQSGVREFFMTRRLTSSIPVDFIDNSDVRGDTPPSVYTLDESTAVTGFNITQRLLTPWVQVQNTTEVPPADNIVEQTLSREFLFGDTTTYSTRIVAYDIPGMVHDEGTFRADPVKFGEYVGYEAQWRFARGAPVAEIPILGTSPIAYLQVGDEALVNVSYFPNRNYRIGEALSVGPRAMQIVRRDETPEGPNFKLVDSGLTLQPTLVPTFTLRRGSDQQRIAAIDITNYNLLNTLGDASIAIQWSTGASAPTADGTPFANYPTPFVPESVELPPVIPGSTVHVRMRTEQKALRPSAWTAWTSFTLNAWTAPSSVNTDFLSNTSTDLTWSLGSPANTKDYVEVYLAPGSVAPSDWTPYRVNTLAAGTTRTTIVDLTASTNYIAGITYRDQFSNSRSTMATKTFTTTAGPYYVTGDAGLTFARFLPVISDNRYPSGVPIALYNNVPPGKYEIQRAPQVSGSPGTYETLTIVDAKTDLYVDYLPINGTVYWYRVRNILPLFADGSWFTIGATTAGNVPPDLIVPPQRPPTITYNIRYTATDAIVTFDINSVSGGSTNTVTGGGIWLGDLSASPLIFPPDYTASPTTLARAVGVDTTYTIGARRNGLEERAYFIVPQQ